MRMKCSRCNRARPILLQKAGVRLNTIQIGAIEIEYIDVMTFSSSALESALQVITLQMTYVAKTGACSCTLRVRKVCFVAVMV